MSVGEVQHPQQRTFVVGRLDGAAGRAVEAAPPELRLAVRAQIHKAAVRFEDLDDVEADPHRFAE